MTANDPNCADFLRDKRVFVAGHRGMVGSALCRRLAREECEILLADRSLDLREQAETEAWIRRARPNLVFVAAARVGGILANAEHPATFLFDNLMIAANVIHASKVAGVEKLVFLASSCVYPKFAPQPIPESALLSGSLESTNEAYAVAKIAGLKLTEAYRAQYGCNYMTMMPASLYGPNDNFDPKSAHVIPALIRKLHEAKCNGNKTVEIWGSGLPRREFLHVDDFADACIHVATRKELPTVLNVGAGCDIAVSELAELIREVVDYDGAFIYNTTKPDGTPRKLLDSTKINNSGWHPRIDLRLGIEDLYRHYLERYEPALLDSGMPEESQKGLTLHNQADRTPSNGKTVAIDRLHHPQ